jgi:hypothetical protein
MLKFIFYAMGFFAIYYELWAISNFDKIKRFSKKLHISDEERPELTTNESIFIILMCGYFIWCFVGLFTSQWLVFVGLFILSILTSVINKIGRTKAWNFIDSLACVLLILFAILNTFHFHIDLWKFLVKNS